MSKNILRRFSFVQIILAEEGLEEKVHIGVEKTSEDLFKVTPYDRSYSGAMASSRNFLHCWFVNFDKESRGWSMLRAREEERCETGSGHDNWYGERPASIGGQIAALEKRPAFIVLVERDEDCHHVSHCVTVYSLQREQVREHLLQELERVATQLREEIEAACKE